MTKRTLKSIRTLASESKARRKVQPSQEQIEKLNKHFDEIERLQQEEERLNENSKRKIAKQPEV
ncbi:MAG: hypothetical protein KDD22_00820 [Bdellovibrionales bacterium]|nr:hypothetical protein [Bdellovibrionales bacterium]